MSWSDEWFEREFATSRVMVIMRGLGAGPSLDLAERAWAAGVRAVEIPVQRPEDLRSLETVARAARGRGLAVGAGTVVRVDQVPLVRDAGAAYTVSPGLDEGVVRASLDAGLPTLPGVATATEIQRATSLGLGWLKAFPASTLGPGWIRAMRGPFPDVRLVATGGVTAANAGELLAAGARVVALGSALADPAQLGALSQLAARG